MIKIENWNGHNIRFVEHNSEWWAVAKDVADALNFRDADAATRKMPDKYKGTCKVRITSDKTKAPETQEMIILNEKGIYRFDETVNLMAMNSVFNLGVSVSDKIYGKYRS